MTQGVYRKETPLGPKIVVCGVNFYTLTKGVMTEARFAKGNGIPFFYIEIEIHLVCNKTKGRAGESGAWMKQEVG